jgi:hypothetical protein
MTCSQPQVFDSGLIGEGVLHLLLHAKAKLLADDATIVPAAASVYVQPIQFRRHSRAKGLNVEVANSYHWRQDYEGVELAQCRWC